MSQLRPECRSTTSPVTVDDGTAYYCILGAVEEEAGLIHGKLHSRAGHCAVGSYFARQPRAVLCTRLVDEVAAVNDSVPHATEAQRKRFVTRWLRWKLTQMRFPGYRTWRKPKAA